MNTIRLRDRTREAAKGTTGRDPNLPTTVPKKWIGNSTNAKAREAAAKRLAEEKKGKPGKEFGRRLR